VARRDPDAGGPRRIPRLRRERAGLRPARRTRGAGAFTGSEDQTAILCSRAGELAQYAFLPVRRERDVPLDAEWSFVVASSGVASDKTGAVKDRYNRISLAARAILDLWNGSARRNDPSLYAAAHGLPDAAERIRNLVRVIPVPGFDPGYPARQIRPAPRGVGRARAGRRRAAREEGRRADRPARRPLAGALGDGAPEPDPGDDLPRARGSQPRSRRRVRVSGEASAGASGRSRGQTRRNRSAAAGRSATPRSSRRRPRTRASSRPRPGPPVVEL
jgi:hypothetical protein